MSFKYKQLVITYQSLVYSYTDTPLKIKRSLKKNMYYMNIYTKFILNIIEKNLLFTFIFFMLVMVKEY